MTPLIGVETLMLCPVNLRTGTMAERTIAPVLKTGSPQGSGVRIPLVPPSE